MQRSSIVRPAAMFWGLAVYMPVGVTYLSALLLLLALLVAGNGRERIARLRANPLWWPVVAYVAWTLVVLAVRPHYPETPSNLVHGLRIAATFLMAMALARDEALWALRGFLLISALNLVLIVVFYAVGGFSIWSPLRGVVMEVGNKSISNALLFSVVAATAAVWGLSQIAARRPMRSLPAFALVLLLVAVVALPLTSRTSVLALLMVLPLVCIHQWRSHLKLLSAALIAGAVVLGAGLYQLPQLQQKVETGIEELEKAQTGEVYHGSMVIRYYMYRDTGRMIADSPLTGWGIGGWTDQWHRRGPALFADSNMPHNDFLWMGAQGGLPGLLSLLAIMVAAVWQAWRRPDIAGRYALAATLIALIASCVNSALRDAQIGLALLWIAMIYLRLAQETRDADPWRGLWPGRRAPVRTEGEAAAIAATTVSPTLPAQSTQAGPSAAQSLQAGPSAANSGHA